MELKALLVHVFAFHVLIIFLILSCFLSVSVFSKFTRDELLNGQTCTSSQMSFNQEGVSSVVQCAFQCSTTPSCVGIFHQKQTGICVGCGSFGEGELQSLEGTQFYGSECPDIEPPDNGKIIGNLTGVGNRIEFECDFGYRVNGSKYAICLHNGTWNVTDTKCDKIPVRNAARGQPTEMSTVWKEYGGYRGVDGLTDRINATGCFLTLFEDNPWWRVDLEGVNSIINITLFNSHGDACQSAGFSDCSHQAYNLKLSVGLSLETMSVAGFEASQIEDIYSFNFTEDIQARYVKVELIGRPIRSLQLCEVQVFGFPVY